jgi:ABC-type antimicrobial peptide transport system permease subunit
LVRRELLALDRNIPLTRIKTMKERAAAVASRTRFLALVLSLFGGLALLLAGMGIYGVMAYSVSARTRELGIRMALGAHGGAVQRLVVVQGMKLGFLGLGLGLALALGMTRSLKSLLFGVSALDPLILLQAVLGLVGVGLLACWLPARRAAKVDPMQALRSE